MSDLNLEALAIFGVVVAITLGITYWASKRTTSATHFWAPGAASRGRRTASRSPATT
jgi:cation/acetate symporter